ncbi:patatin-like phospholipase family protein [Lutibacter sp. B2]|nr:patatin-like phospholipase family protein [Lutibacter sp. B2]
MIEKLKKKYKIGLVLSGGGAKAAYQIGVLKSFKRYGLYEAISSVSGTSAGALNVGLFLQDDLELAQKIWMNTTKSEILNFKYRNLKRAYLCSLDGIKDMLNDKNIDYKKMSESKVKSYITYCIKDKHIFDLKTIYYQLNGSSIEPLKEVFTASCRIPFIYERLYIENKVCLDGAVGNNIPIDPVYKDGCDLIFVIHFDRSYPINYKLYKNAKIIEIVPQNIPTGFLNDIFSIQQNQIVDRINEGYKDGERMINSLFDENVDCVKKQKLRNNFTIDSITNKFNNMIMK